MLMPQTVEYAFRALACLASADDGLVRVEDLAARADVPRPYLSRVMRQLVVAGLVVSQRGVHGGYRLARPAAAISFSSILDAMHFDAGGGRCAFGLSRCDAMAPCPMHESWVDLRRQFDAWASGHSLDDLVRGGAGTAGAGASARRDGERPAG